MTLENYINQSNPKMMDSFEVDVKISDVTLMHILDGNKFVYRLNAFKIDYIVFGGSGGMYTLSDKPSCFRLIN
jgi:hypothetical protein